MALSAAAQDVLLPLVETQYISYDGFHALSILPEIHHSLFANYAHFILALSMRIDLQVQKRGKTTKDGVTPR
jgi:hypothetical protein